MFPSALVPLGSLALGPPALGSPQARLPRGPARLLGHWWRALAKGHPREVTASRWWHGLVSLVLSCPRARALGVPWQSRRCRCPRGLAATACPRADQPRCCRGKVAIGAGTGSCLPWAQGKAAASHILLFSNSLPLSLIFLTRLFVWSGMRHFAPCHQGR